MPPPPPEGLRLCAKPGRPLIYCGDNGYESFGLPADYAKRAATAWGWSGVRIVEESHFSEGCIIGRVCRANYHIDSAANGDVLTLYILVPAAIAAPPPE